MNTETLWRAADDDHVVGSASFAEDRELAKSYLDRPGYGGARLWCTLMPDPSSVCILDLVDVTDPLDALITALGIMHPGAIDVWDLVAHETLALEDAGYDWVRYETPDGIVWTFVGGFDTEPEMQAAR